MLSGTHHYNVLSSAYDKQHLMDQAKKSGIFWDEHKHEGVNWMRCSNAIVQHLNSGKQLHVDGADLQRLTKMRDLYTQLREEHKQTMIPVIRAAMYKLRSESGVSDYKLDNLLSDSYKHLDANGGHIWAEKVSTLSNINGHIRKLSDRINGLSQLNQNDPNK